MNQKRDEEFKPSYSLSKLITIDGATNNPVLIAKRQEFSLNERYQRSKQQLNLSADLDNQNKKEEQQIDDLNSLFTNEAGRKEIQLIQQIKQKSLTKQRSDVYKKYQDFIESEKQKISEENPLQQQLQVESLEKQQNLEQFDVEMDSKEFEFDEQEYEKLMKPNQILNQLPHDVNDISIREIIKEQMFVLQFPPVLPYDQIIQTLNSQTLEQKKNIDDQQEQLKEFYQTNISDSSGFSMKRSFKEFISEDKLKIPKQEPYGIRLGKIQIKGDGSASFLMNDIQFDLTHGIPTVQDQELVKIDEENKKFEKLGSIRQKLVAKPKVKDILMI